MLLASLVRDNKDSIYSNRGTKMNNMKKQNTWEKIFSQMLDAGKIGPKMTDWRKLRDVSWQNIVKRTREKQASSN